MDFGVAADAAVEGLGGDPVDNARALLPQDRDARERNIATGIAWSRREIDRFLFEEGEKQKL